MNQKLIEETKLFLNSINETIEIPENDSINEIINNKIFIIECLLKKETIPISLYKKKYIKIITTEKCIECHRKAEYQNQDNLKEKHCWTHTQKL